MGANCGLDTHNNEVVSKIFMLYALCQFFISQASEMHLQLALKRKVASGYKWRSKLILPTACFNVNIKLPRLNRLESIKS